MIFYLLLHVWQRHRGDTRWHWGDNASSSRTPFFYTHTNLYYLHPCLSNTHTLLYTHLLICIFMQLYVTFCSYLQCLQIFVLNPFRLAFAVPPTPTPWPLPSHFGPPLLPSTVGRGRNVRSRHSMSLVTPNTNTLNVNNEVTQHGNGNGNRSLSCLLATHTHTYNWKRQQQKVLTACILSSLSLSFSLDWHLTLSQRLVIYFMLTCVVPSDSATCSSVNPSPLSFCSPLAFHSFLLCQNFEIALKIFVISICIVPLFSVCCLPQQLACKWSYENYSATTTAATCGMPRVKKSVG